jgi:hypothetical protein
MGSTDGRAGGAAYDSSGFRGWTGVAKAGEEEGIGFVAAGV